MFEFWYLLLNALKGNKQQLVNLYCTILKCNTRYRNQHNIVNCIQYIF